MSDLSELNRQVGELTVAVQSMADQMERDRDERKEYRKETRNRLSAHSTEIKGLQRVRNIMAGALGVIAAVLGAKLHWPF